ncbi:MAG: methionyl-tRNA formyltransferase [Lachnospiraceae bacterium]|nr:methionyl-tRNA formyltransferase [Lachnospiraceae bacterium]
MITLGYFGDGPWAHRAFEKLVEDSTIRIGFVTVRYDCQDPILIRLAKEQGIPVELSQNINSDEFLNRINKYNVNLFVSMSFNQIFRERTINYPALKSINCHAGKLPYYRGRNILNWVLINDEKEFGVTVHYIDKGIDTGDIIIQKTYPISDDDNYKTLLETAYKGCADVLYEAIKQIQHGTVNRIKQNSIDPIGMYCGMRGPGDEVIDWNSTSRELFNFIRAICKPGPMATSLLNGKEIKINRCREIPNARTYKNKPGQIIGKTDSGFYVKTRDTFVEVLEYEYDGGIRVGDRMG